MKHSFAPFSTDAVALLSRGTGIDFTGCNFADDRTWLCVTGRNDRGLVVGVAAWEFKTWYDAHFNAVILDQHVLTRRLLTAMFLAVFTRATRVSALIEPHNARAVRQVRRMGFREEGFMRNAVEGFRDALLFGLIAEECRYLEVDHGQHSQAA